MRLLGEDRIYLRRGGQALVVSGLGYGLGYAFTSLIHPESAAFGAMWAAVSGLAVLQDEVVATRQAANARVWGSLIGAVLACVALLLYPFTIIGLALTAGLAALIGAISPVRDGGRLPAITVTVVMGISLVNPALEPMEGAALRFSEACLGAASALLVAWGWRSVVQRWRGR